MSNNTLKSFRVCLFEDSEAKGTIIFDCQAEDVDHASEQALNAYPQGRVENITKLDVVIGQWPQVGDTVWWVDPDDNIGTGLYTVHSIQSESGKVESSNTILVLKHEGSIAEVFALELRRPPSIEQLICDVRNSESDDGCENGYTVVSRPPLMTLLEKLESTDAPPLAKALEATQQALAQAMEHAHKLQKQRDEAVVFMGELLDSTETLTGIAEQHGPRTLADLMYLHSAILTGGFIDYIPGESAVMELVQQLPSAARWMEFIKTDYMLSEYREGDEKNA